MTMKSNGSQTTILKTSLIMLIGRSRAGLVPWMCFIPVRLLIGAQIRSLTTRITSLLVNICRTTFVKARYRILVLLIPAGFVRRLICT